MDIESEWHVIEATRLAGQVLTEGWAHAMQYIVVYCSATGVVCC